MAPPLQYCNHVSDCSVQYANKKERLIYIPEAIHTVYGS